jgi:hypothetical protein
VIDIDSLAVRLHELGIGCIFRGDDGVFTLAEIHNDDAARLIAAGVTLAATPPLDVSVRREIIQQAVHRTMCDRVTSHSTDRPCWVAADAVAMVLAATPAPLDERCHCGHLNASCDRPDKEETK